MSPRDATNRCLTAKSKGKTKTKHILLSDDPRFRSATAENIPFYWPESAFPAENHHPASIPPPPLGPIANAYGSEWLPEQLEQLVHNSDGSTSATLTVPHNVITSLFPKNIHLHLISPLDTSYFFLSFFLSFSLSLSHPCNRLPGP